MMPPVTIRNGAKWATIRQHFDGWVVRSWADTTPRQFRRYREAEQYAKHMIR